MTGVSYSEYDKLLSISGAMDNNDKLSDKEKIILFLDMFKLIEPSNEYQNKSQRHYHFNYVGSLVLIKQYVDNKEYHNIIEYLSFLIVEEGEYLLQKRYYVNLIYILEKSIK